MKLNEYLKINGLQNRDMAKKLNVSDTSISLWISGDRFPRRSVACRIIEATNGQVTYEDLYGTPNIDNQCNTLVRQTEPDR
jgi:DNA-binding transcriptional regulator YdaS (Cro superfamily)